jgi:hypothetical protein
MVVTSVTSARGKVRSAVARLSATTDRNRNARITASTGSVASVTSAPEKVRDAVARLSATRGRNRNARITASTGSIASVTWALEKFVMSSPAFPRQPGFATQIHHPLVNPILGSPGHVCRSVPPAAEPIHPAPFNFPPQRIGDDFRCSALYAKAMPLKGVYQLGDGRRTVQPQLPGQHIPKLDSAEAHGRGHGGTVAWWYRGRTSVCAQASCRGKAGRHPLDFPGSGEAHQMPAHT